jgi:peptidoglycan/xylan/chitin deacetylase (PgdA/CDA1 family)
LNLTIGVVSQGTIYDEVLLELLDHQGIIYEIVGERQATLYPVVLISKDSDSARSLARTACDSDEGVLFAEKLVDMEQIFRYLAGSVEEKTDRLAPKVNEEELRLTEAIRSALSAANLPLVTKWFWPGMAKACCVLTHDVDWLSYGPFHKAVLKGGFGPGRLLSLAGIAVKGGVGGKNFGWNVPETVDLESRHGVKSTFLLRTTYDDAQHLIKPTLEALRSKGFEIALHASNSSQSEEGLLREELRLFKEMVGSEPAGLRHHILKFSAPKTWEIESALRLEYDGTFAHNRYFGFRGGICFPYRPFGSTRFPITELPMGFMDFTAMHKGLRGPRFSEKLAEVKETIEKFHGVLVVNFHNTYLNRETFPDIFGAYKTLLDDVTTEGYWVATAQECARWWQFRASARATVTMDASGNVVGQSEVPLALTRQGQESIQINA